MNGYNKYSSGISDWLYYPNNRPRDIEISFSDGLSMFVTLDDVFDSRNHIFQEIQFDTVKETTSVRVFVHNVYRGTRWNETCISEIQVY